LVFSHAGINLQQKKIQELKQKIYELTGTKRMFKPKMNSNDLQYNFAKIQRETQNFK
jgi:hypothetical protein